MNSISARAITFLVLSLFLSGQHLPRVDEECRSEMDERLAFGLCEDGRFDFYASGNFKEGIPTPEAFLGYPIGSWHTTYGRMERYIHALQEAAPNRVFIEQYGKSIEQQNMMMLIISSENNIRNLEQIRLQIHRLANPEKTNLNAAKRLAATTPVMIWLNPANDGNETAAFEACLQIAYQLAAGEDSNTQHLRENAVV
ncbi:MAG: M14 family zinc carboxypeptidase, partial [Candidatus Marinimicrobia bacterium]|nr:M14 family zinc carboxypeptidase [Candidatus Neomarinimicrobiota bacterium]